MSINFPEPVSFILTFSSITNKDSWEILEKDKKTCYIKIMFLMMYSAKKMGGKVVLQ